MDPNAVGFHISRSDSAFLFNFEFMDAVAATICAQNFRSKHSCCEAYIESQAVTRQGPMMVVEDGWRVWPLQDTNRCKGSEHALSGCVVSVPFRVWMNIQCIIADFQEFIGVDCDSTKMRGLGRWVTTALV